MTWELYRWIWRLEAPMFIGMPPSGSLNRCRLYVPARAIWGAITAEIARSTGDTFPDAYNEIGKSLSNNCRFTYLYPSEKADDEYRPWLPVFVETKGLAWRFQGNSKGMTHLQFRCRLLDSRPGTAIAPKEDSAAEGPLRETECVLPWWRKTAGDGSSAKPVYLVGYVFVKDEQCKVLLRATNTLFLGGDTRYGLGRIRSALFEKISGNPSVFGCRAELEKEDPVLMTDIVLGMAPAELCQEEMTGAQEAIGGWDRRSMIKAHRICWVPGSRSKRQLRWAIGKQGYWTGGP